MARWSKLQREIYNLVEPTLSLRIHCARYRMDSQRGSTDLPRYWITLASETIWDYPKDFVDRRHPDRTPPDWYPYRTDMSAISDLIREYIDTPKTELLTRVFPNDHWGLINILRAADRRVGGRRLQALARKTRNRAARRVIEARAEHHAALDARKSAARQ